MKFLRKLVAVVVQGIFISAFSFSSLPRKVDTTRHYNATILTQSDLDLMQRFEACHLDATAWTHEAHVHTAWIALVQAECNCTAATNRMRDGIQNFNAQILHRPGAYHETITVAFVHLICHRILLSLLQPKRNVTWNGFVRGDNNDLITTNPLLQYYSAKLLFSNKARAVFCPPDLQPLPSLAVSEDKNNNEE